MTSPRFRLSLNPLTWSSSQPRDSANSPDVDRGTSSISSDTGSQQSSDGSRSTTFGTESEDNIFGSGVSRAPSEYDEYFENFAWSPPGPSLSPTLGSSASDHDAHPVQPRLRHRLPIPVSQARRSRLSIRSHATTVDNASSPTSLFTPNYSMSTLPSPSSHFTSATSLGSPHRDAYESDPPSPKTRPVHPSNAQVAEEAALGLLGLKLNDEHGSDGEEEEAEGDHRATPGRGLPRQRLLPGSPRTPRRARPPSPDITPHARGGTGFRRKYDHTTPVRPAPKPPVDSPVPSLVTSQPQDGCTAEGSSANPISSLEPILSVLRSIPKTTTITLFVDQEGVRDRSEKLHFMRIHRPDVFREIERAAQHNAASWGEAPGKPQPFQETGCIEFGVHPRKRPKWMFHHSVSVREPSRRRR